MSRAKKTSRRPLDRQRLAGITISIQRTHRPGFEACVTMRQNGKRVRVQYCRTTEEAKAFSQRLSIEAGNTGAKAAASLTDMQKRFLVEAEERLSKFGKTLRDAVDFYEKHLGATHSSVALCNAVDALLAHRKKKGKSPRYLNDLRVRLSRFERDFTGRMISEITRDEVEQWLDSLTTGARTHNHFRTVLHTLWGFAMDKQWARENVLGEIEAQTVRAERPGILSLEQVRALLNASVPAILPYYAIALFGGLRDAELRRLDWKDVNFLTGYIRISSTVSKTGRERLVPISDNLNAWLKPVATARGPITPRNVRNLLELARTTAEIKTWPHDATRHSFGTYEMARTKDIGHVSEVMGNSPAIVQRHYKAAVPFEHGAQYFAIIPSVVSD